MRSIKRIFRRIVLVISWVLVRLYIKRFKPIIIGVAGSVGKTGTKRAIAHILSSKKRVAWQEGNYNDITTVPLVFFGLAQPPLLNPIQWLLTFMRMAFRLFGRGAEVVVIELGTDGPGQIKEFSKYLVLDYGVVTAISHEHMENFKTLEAVAREELEIMKFAKQKLVAEDVVSKKYVSAQNVTTYGNSRQASVRIVRDESVIHIVSSRMDLTAKTQLVGHHQHEALAVAAHIASDVGIDTNTISSAIASLKSMPGRMNVLRGLHGSVLVDDTYNASPIALQKALQYLYDLPQKHKIAVIGNMNEMGAISQTLHTEAAKYCDPRMLKEVITIGSDANQFLAPAARRRGLTVSEWTNPYDIGDYLKKQSLQNTAILFKGSQNGVFLEEAIKPLLENPQDTTNLVRQSAYWLKLKHTQRKDTK